MKRDYVLELRIVIRSEDLQKLRFIEERLSYLIVKENMIDTTYEIGGGIREADDGEKTS